MGRLLIKTGVSGWFIDSTDLDGTRVRHQEDDVVITREEWDALGTQDGDLPEVGVHDEEDDIAVAVNTAIDEADEEVQVTVSDTGKLLKGKTITISCKHKDPETKKVCGKDRVIKPQDAFQVKFCVPHQLAHRAAIKREKMKAKRKADAIARKALVAVTA